jgi:uncharacterized protein (TIGR03067 family)
MKSSLWPVVLAGSLVTADVPRPDVSSHEVASTLPNGTWKALWAACDQEVFRRASMRIKDGEVDITADRLRLGMWYECDPNTSPPSVDFHLVGNKHRGIYVIEGDRLRVCWTIRVNGPRPTQFSGQAQPGVVQMILRRAGK